jgi:alpha-tubulin suppressor-like RCC1 family protein
MVIAGYAHSCGVTTSGAGYCWGSNGSGALGNGTTTSSNVPVVVSGGHVFASISPGRVFSCGLTTAGQAYCWGTNVEGELGDGGTTPRTTPIAVSGQLTFAQISAGGFHACGLTTGGQAYCWGWNAFGQLGIGSAGSLSNTPRAVAGGLTFASLSAGNRHTCGVTTAGVGYCWGDNSNDMLGTGLTTTTSAPELVAGGLSWAAISAGRFHTCGVTTAGAAYCWGAGGAIGDGTSQGRPVPTRVF